MRLLNFFLVLLIMPAFVHAQHPVAYMKKADILALKNEIPKYPLLKESYREIKADVDAWLGKDVDVPFPKDPAGGYTHDKHKANYTLMFNSGLLYNLTGDQRYALLVKNMLLKYAQLNPTLKNHPESTSSSPGRIFWQALNDANWLVYTGMAYDLVRESLSLSERKQIEDGAFKPEVDFFTKDLKPWFNLVHNHGVWACAGVGIVGIATDNNDYVEMALKGTEKIGNGGFLAQLDGLFSPDGYYTEGPYYVRYAILPYYLFANALYHARPELKIFEHRNQILRKALLAALQQTNLNGTFFPINDALKEKDYTSNELVTAIDIAWEVYGKDNGLLTVAKKQDRVLLSKGGASIAAALAGKQAVSSQFPYTSVEYRDGAKGDEGGVSLLRSGSGKDLTTLIFKYTSHGLSHGHFDKLNYNLFDKGNEVITDYGSVRFIGVEQKYGGRYLAENKAYAGQTIAHNTLVVDGASHFNGKEEVGEKYHADKLFSDISKANLQVVIAEDEHAYDGVRMQRSLYMLQLPGEKKFIIDLFHVTSDKPHQYDLPFQYSGNLISTSFKYNAFTNQQETLGKKNGYQFLWKEAVANVKDTLVQLTFLNERTYYTISSAIHDSAQLFLTRSGANDPNFNLRHDPAFIIRKQAKDESFLNLIEIHGNFDPIMEFSSNSYSTVKKITWLKNEQDISVASILINGKELLIAQANKDFNKASKHSFGTGAAAVQWNGPYYVTYDGKSIQ
ncbi:MAG: alginate lyase family protein [Ferruginibacter sp.]|nr:alginate lyase family protein [Ferruginibacter sp.]